MTISVYYEIVFNDGLIDEEMYELKDTAYTFGIDRLDRTDNHILEVVFMNQKDEDIKDLLQRIAAWTGRIALDTCINNIKHIVRYDTNYEYEPLNELLLRQEPKGSC